MWRKVTNQNQPNERVNNHNLISTTHQHHTLTQIHSQKDGSLGDKSDAIAPSVK